MGNCASATDKKVHVTSESKVASSTPEETPSSDVMLLKHTQPSSGEPTTPSKPYWDTPQFSRFLETYKLDSDVLGQGGFAVVQSGIRKVDKCRVAVKMVHRLGKETDVAVLALHKEHEVLRKLNHPHIVQALDFYENEKQLRFVLEYLDGGELFNRIVTKSFYNEKEARDLVVVLLSGIKYLHDNNVVHR
jgi:hypothetical protein